MCIARLEPGLVDWSGVVLLLSGASAMGKSTLSRAVLVVEYGAVCSIIDRVYTRALLDAGVLSDDQQSTPAAKIARRQARDRRWPTSETAARFFVSYQRQIERTLEVAKRRAAPAVIEGGSLRMGDEASTVLAAARTTHQSRERVVRVTLEIPFDTWVRNRTQRLKNKGRECEPRLVSHERYVTEVRRARPEPLYGLIDRTVDSADTLRHLMAQLRAPQASDR